MLRLSCLNFALSSFLVGGFIIADPIGFFGLFGIELGEPIVASVYGGAIVGEGLACLWGWFEPARVTGVLLYMVAYKSVVVLTLTPRLLVMEDPPFGGALIVAAWGLVAVWAAILYPWRGDRASASGAV